MDIDRPVADYLPSFRIRQRFPDAPDITLRQLMTHHSGLPTDLMRGADTKTPQSLGELTSQLKDQFAAQRPGQVFQYSNLGFAVLGRVLERYAGH